MRYFRNGSVYFFMVGRGKIRLWDGNEKIVGIGLRYINALDNELLWFYIQYGEIDIWYVPEEVRQKIEERMSSEFFEIDLRKMIMKEEIFDVELI